MIFLSWESDRHECRNFVLSALEKLPNKLSGLTTINVDRDTYKVPGSPDIGDTIFEKIDRCDLFVADVTLINSKESKIRLTPNPNVMIELGYAIKSLGWDHIILLQCKDYGDIEELPFDINHRRICNFTLGAMAEDESDIPKIREASKKTVTENISETIKLLLDRNQLFGGKKGSVPKFEISFCSSGGTMMNLRLYIKNVSTHLISELEGHDLWVEFHDKTRKDISTYSKFEQRSLASGEQTVVNLNNPILGAGSGYSNAVWENIDLKWQFSCEDELSTEYWYEMTAHIANADKPQNTEKWNVRNIG